MFLIVNANPALQKIYFLDSLKQGAVNRVNKLLTMAGGKGVNTARAFSCMGFYDYTLLAYAPLSINNILSRDLGVDHSSVIVETNRSLRTCTTLIDKNNKVTEITEPSMKIDADAKNNFRAEYEKLIQRSKMLLISGSLIAGEDHDFYYQLIQIANMCKVPVILDFYGKEILDTIKAKVDFLKINRDEFLQLGKMFNVKKEKEIIYCLQYQHKVKNIIVTNKDKDVSVFTDNRVFTVSVPKVEAINTTGCGDAFTAGFMLEYAISGDLDSAVRKGIAVAAASSVTQEMAVFDKSYADAIYKDMITCSDSQQNLF